MGTNAGFVEHPGHPRQGRVTIMLQDKKCIDWAGIFGAALVLLFVAIPSLSQLPTGTILGVVKDSSGAVIPGASLTIINIDTSLTRFGSSAETGPYRFPALPVGRLRMAVSTE